MYPELVNIVSQQVMEDEYLEEPSSHARFDDTEDDVGWNPSGRSFTKWRGSHEQHEEHKGKREGNHKGKREETLKSTRNNC